MVTPKFANIAGSNFHSELKKRVQTYFLDKKKKSTGNFNLFFKAGLLWALYIFLYVHTVFFTPPLWIAFIECFFMGVITAAIGFNVMHDGGHGCFSESKFWNKAAAYSANALGASGILWHNKHNIIHHTYTNIDGVDDDIEIKPMLRMCPTQKRYFFHRFQHIYVWLLYPMLLLLWLFHSDFDKYFRKKVGEVPLKKMSSGEHFRFWIAKVVYFFAMIAVPIWMVGFVPFLIGFLTLALTAGFILSIVFQLAHTVEETSFPMPDPSSNKLEAEWALHQISTTANFATSNKLVSWFIGGLNFQIEHHLFPKISHVHYPEISKIIRQTCIDFNIRYIEFRRLRQAVASHAGYLKKMGRAD